MISLLMRKLDYVSAQKIQRQTQQVHQLLPTWTEGEYYQEKSKFTSVSAACLSAVIGSNLA